MPSTSIGGRTLRNKEGFSCATIDTLAHRKYTAIACSRALIWELNRLQNTRTVLAADYATARLTVADLPRPESAAI